MVGTRRTNSCDSCRKRRVKCDQVRPVCGQCAKGARECKESLPPHLNWVKRGQLCVPVLPTHTTAESASASVLKPEAAPKELSLVKSTSASNGVVFHKYRICPVAKTKSTTPNSVDGVPRTPPLSFIDTLRHDFFVACLHCPVGHRLTALNPRIDDVPRYLGRSTALDQAAGCLIDSHRSLLTGDNRCEINANTYHKALKSLQESLDDPLQVSESATLCAVSLLGCVEIVGNRFLNWNYINHASGLVTLIRTHGQVAAQDNLGKSILYSAVGPIIVDAIMKGTHCFLNEPEWHWLFSAWPATSPAQAVRRAVMTQLSYLANILADIRSACGFNGSIASAQALVPRVLAAQEAIRRACEDMYLTLSWETSSTSLTSQDSAEPDDTLPLNVSYWYTDLATARVALQCWAMVIQVNDAIDALHSYLSERHIEAFTEQSMVEMRLESRKHAEDICRSVEYAKQYTPVGSLYMSYPIFCAWTVLPNTKKDWIVTELNDLNGCLMSDYNHASMDYIAKNVIGCIVPARDEIRT